MLILGGPARVLVEAAELIVVSTDLRRALLQPGPVRGPGRRELCPLSSGGRGNELSGVRPVPAPSCWFSRGDRLVVFSPGQAPKIAAQAAAPSATCAISADRAMNEPARRPGPSGPLRDRGPECQAVAQSHLFVVHERRPGSPAEPAAERHASHAGQATRLRPGRDRPSRSSLSTPGRPPPWPQDAVTMSGNVTRAKEGPVTWTFVPR